jgi:hypothetical protein
MNKKEQEDKGSSSGNSAGGGVAGKYSGIFSVYGLIRIFIK